MTSPHLPETQSQRLSQLLRGLTDPFNLPEPGELDELLVRIAALESQLRFMQSALNGRVEKLTAEVHALRRERAALAPRLALAEATPALAHDLVSALTSQALARDTMARHLAEFRTTLAAGPLSRRTLEDFLAAMSEGLAVQASAGQRAEELTAGLKAVSADERSGRRRRFELAEVVADVLVALKPALRRAQVQTTVVIPPGIVLDSYPGALAQVLINLVQNALVHAFADQGGQITFTGVLAGEGHVRLSVRDNGKGIPLEVQERLFEPYFTTRPGQGGTGLGLSSARATVREVLGGELRAESPGTGQGARFVLDLPRHP